MANAARTDPPRASAVRLTTVLAAIGLSATVVLGAKLCIGHDLPPPADPTSQAGPVLPDPRPPPPTVAYFPPPAPPVIDHGHDRDGQNVLYGAPCSLPVPNPFAGVQRDCIYTVGNAFDPATSAHLIGQPISANDSVMLPPDEDNP